MTHPSTDESDDDRLDGAPDEELPEHRPVGRALIIVGVLALVALGVYAIVASTRGDSDSDRGGPAPTASVTATPTPTLSIAANPTSVPEQDALPVLNTCGGECVTYSLGRTALQHTGMRGLTGGFGLRVTDGRHEQLRSIVGRAAGAQVRLLYEHVNLADAALRVTDSRGPGRTVVLALIRDGWRLTAVLVGATAPVAAATAWARSAPLP